MTVDFRLVLGQLELGPMELSLTPPLRSIVTEPYVLKCSDCSSASMSGA